MAELADALDLGSSVNRRGGSSPSSRTKTSYPKSDICHDLLVAFSLEMQKSTKCDLLAARTCK